MREIVLDTETTGLDPAAGHRIVEIGALELQHHLPTGREYHAYLNPDREMPEDAFAIHGLSDDFLAGKDKFAGIADAFLEFIGDAPLVIHNAEFDLRFLNHELKLTGRDPIDDTRAVDTMLIARQKFPGARASLDALCQRFEIDLAVRDKHGALIDRICSPRSIWSWSADASRDSIWPPMPNGPASRKAPSATGANRAGTCPALRRPSRKGRPPGIPEENRRPRSGSPNRTQQQCPRQAQGRPPTRHGNAPARDEDFHNRALTPSSSGFVAGTQGGEGLSAAPGNRRARPRGRQSG